MEFAKVAGMFHQCICTQYISACVAQVNHALVVVAVRPCVCGRTGTPYQILAGVDECTGAHASLFDTTCTSLRMLCYSVAWLCNCAQDRRCCFGAGRGDLCSAGERRCASCMLCTQARAGMLQGACRGALLVTSQGDMRVLLCRSSGLSVGALRGAVRACWYQVYRRWCG